MFSHSINILQNYFNNSNICFIRFDFKQFAGKISFSRFHKQTQRESDLRYIYKNVLIYSFLIHIFSKKVQFNKSAKKSDLISNHSIKQKTKTKDLIQKYVKNHSYSSCFPSHRREAIDYFEVCVSMHISEYLCLYFLQYTERIS